MTNIQVLKPFYINPQRSWDRCLPYSEIFIMEMKIYFNE